MKRIIAASIAWSLMTASVMAQTVTVPTPSTVGTAVVGQIPGTATNDNACAGCVGEYLSNPGSAISLTSPTPKNCATITLTAGDWDVSSMTEIFGASGTSQTIAETSLSTVTNTLNTTSDRFTADIGVTKVTPDNTYAIPSVRYSVSVSTPVFLVVASTFTISTMSMNCMIHARRVR